jgi:hypothetical protein
MSDLEVNGTLEWDDDPRAGLVRLGNTVIRPSLITHVQLERTPYGRPSLVTVHLQQDRMQIQADLEGKDAEAARRYFMAPEVDAP